MTESATVAWLDGAASAEDQKLLESWARARGVVLALPSKVDAAESRRVDPATISQIEAHIAAAKDATAKQELGLAEQSLSSAEALVRAHPELPQAAWLLAEVERGWAARFLIVPPKDEARATLALARARALDGGRTAGVGERSLETNDKPVHYTLTAGVPDGARLVVDGVATEPGERSALEGLHHVRVEKGGVTLFASFVGVGEGSLVRVSAEGALPCSRADLSGVARGAGGAIVTDGARCGSWVAVVHGGRGELLVATCRAGACGELLPWSAAHEERPIAPAAHVHAGFPLWATVTLASLGVLAVAGAVVGVVFATQQGTTSYQFTQGPTKIERFRWP